MKKILAVLLSLLMISQVTVFAVTDNFVLTDTPVNTYVGRKEATTMINNLQFKDIPNDFWAREPIIRSGALNIVKGYDGIFNPNGKVTNEEALAFVIRAMGLENAAITRAQTLQAGLPAGSPLRTRWTIGYLDLARQNGLITPAEYADSLLTPSPELTFNRAAVASRETIANWLYKGLLIVNADTFAGLNNETVQKLISFKDFDQVAADKAVAIEKITSAGFMAGDDKGNFNPKGFLTRAQMAQVFKNMDNTYYSIMGYEKKTGTVGMTKDEQNTSTGEASVARNIYVRKADGKMDLLQYKQGSSNTGTNSTDAVVLTKDAVGGLGLLQQGDELEYIVNKTTSEVLYVQVVKAMTKIEVQGYLNKINIENNSIVIKDSSGKEFTYSLAQGLITTEKTEKTDKNEKTKNYLYMDLKKQDISKLPFGSIVNLSLTNNIVREIKYVGQPTVFNEIRGIVTENNVDLGYLSIIDNSGKEVVKYYYESDLKVEKQQYYDLEDEIGYIDDVFPNFKYDPRDTDMSSIEPGDIVFIKLSEESPDYFVAISAATDYVMRYGKIKEIIDNTDYISVLLEYENKQTAWYNIVDDVFVSRDGKPLANSDIKVGDWAKVLVNQAILEPGNVMESAKELIIEGEEHYITSIYKGNLSNVDMIQNKLVLKDGYVLNKTGWADHKNLIDFSLSGKDIEYYSDGKKISLDYAMKFFKRSDADVYVALENHFTGEKVKKVTFRSGRDEALGADTILTGDGVNTFSTLSHLEQLSADNGTIIRRYGRLVDPQNIMASDYAYVVKNGDKSAAVVDIVDAPSTELLMFARGRIQSVDAGKNFTVQSMSILNGVEWSYTPVQRVFTIDHNTIFLTQDGAKDFKDFLGFTDQTVVDKVYNIVVIGSKAVMVSDSKYAYLSVKGTIYEIGDNQVKLKDAVYYEPDTGKWKPVSKTDSTITVDFPKNSLIGKDNKTVLPKDLKVGDHLKVMTNEYPPSIAKFFPNTNPPANTEGNAEVKQELNALITIVEK